MRLQLLGERELWQIKGRMLEGLLAWPAETEDRGLDQEARGPKQAACDHSAAPSGDRDLQREREQVLGEAAKFESQRREAKTHKASVDMRRRRTEHRRTDRTWSEKTMEETVSSDGVIVSPKKRGGRHDN